MKNECLSAALRELSAAGIRDVKQAHGSKHIQVRWQVNGIERMYSLPVSASDHRAAANTRSMVRRMLRDDGILVTEERKPPPPKQPDRLTLVEQRMAILEQQLSVLSKQVNGVS